MLSGEEREAAHAHICANAHKLHLSVSHAPAHCLDEEFSQRDSLLLLKKDPAMFVQLERDWKEFWLQRSDSLRFDNAASYQLWMVKDTFKHQPFH